MNPRSKNRRIALARKKRRVLIERLEPRQLLTTSASPASDIFDSSTSDMDDLASLSSTKRRRGKRIVHGSNDVVHV